MSSFSKPGHRRLPSTMMDNFRASKPESERDSGFSDASSGYLSAVDLTDSEDTGRTAALAVQEPQSGPQVAVVGGSYPGLSPMIFMNNIVLKQPSPVPPALKSWGFSSSLEMVPQSQLVLLQPTVNNNNSSPKSASDNNRQSRSYLPILKSYPKIAPYPGQSSSGMQALSGERGRSTPGHERRHRRRRRDQRAHASSSPLPGTQTPLRSVSSLEASNTQAQAVRCGEQAWPQPPDWPHSPAPSEMPSLENSDVLSMDNAKVKRFCNTYNALDKSGLLAVALRTKELMRRSRRTQGQLQELQEHTALLTEALESGDPRVWTRLRLMLQDTGTAEPEKEQAQRVEPHGVLT